ncbi:MAG: hypothetical protein THHGLFOP_000824 [Candidatus Fervidibacter sp.]
MTFCPCGVVANFSTKGESSTADQKGIEVRLTTSGCVRKAMAITSTNLSARKRVMWWQGIRGARLSEAVKQKDGTEEAEQVGEVAAEEGRKGACLR